MIFIFRFLKSLQIFFTTLCNFSLRQKIKFRFAFIFLILFFGSNSFSQRGNVAGTVQSVNGAAIIGANIKVIGTLLGSTSNLFGKYEVKNIPFGQYNFEISAIGFKKKLIENVIVDQSTSNLNTILEEELIYVEPIVVTAGKYEQKYSELPSSASLMKSESIVKKNFISLDDALRYVPGVTLTLDQVSIRGSSGYSRGAGTRVLVAFDGIPLYTGDTGEIIWELIPITEIERIEIIKGASSSLYGSTAMGGVINLISNEISSTPFYHLKTYLGFYDKPKYEQWNWSNQYRCFNGITFSESNRFNSFAYSFSLRRLENEGYRQSDFYKRYLGYLRLQYDFSPSTSLSIFVNHLSMKRGSFLYWKNINNVLVPKDEEQGQKVISDRTIIGLNFKNIVNEKIFLSDKFSFYRTDWTDETTSNNTSLTNLFRNELQLNYFISEKLISVNGSEFSLGKVKSNLFQNPKSFGFAGYSQLEYKTDFNLISTFGLRFDFIKLDSLNSTSALSPKIGLNYKLNERTNIRLSIGTGFRSPTLAEAFTSTNANGILIKPNPNLKSEKNISLDAGIRFKPNNIMNFDFAYFQNEYSDFIEPGFNSTFQYVTFNNISKARIQGIELNNEFSLIPNKLKLVFNYLFLNAKEIETNKTLKYRPKNLLTSNISYLIGIFDLGFDFRYWSRAEEIDTELVQLGLVVDGDKRVDVFVLDFRASFPIILFKVPVNFYLNLNNVLNYYYVEMIGNLAPIRNISLSVETTF